MADEECTSACKAAYGGCIQNCARVLFDCLANADTDDKKAECKERFKRGMKLCREAQQICLEACEE